eukprot:jgi/Mesen1/9172/ME000591S08494
MAEFDKVKLVDSLLKVKEESGLTWKELANDLGLTNAYTVQLFLRQAQLKADTATKLQQLLPALTNEQITAMKKFPTRSYDPSILQEPNSYRLQEAVMHYAEALKHLVNEEFGDGIMSAIDFFCTVDKVKGKQNEDRVVITFNGMQAPLLSLRLSKGSKYLPHVEQKVENNTVSVKQVESK